jgi:hypothetical protein
MSYDFKYYSGEMLHTPVKPTKPFLARNPTAVEARAYADALEEYERKRKSYDDNLSWYRREKAELLVKFQLELRTDYGLAESEFNVIWNAAWERGHSCGLEQVYYEFDTLFDFVKEYNKATRGV